MINVMGKQALKLKIIETERPKVKNLWCEEHQADLERIFEMFDALILVARNSNKSIQSYEQLEEMKIQYSNDLVNIYSKYRVVDAN